MQISRLFRLLYLLLERERIPASELAQTLEVSVRTIYRDVQALGEAGIPVYAERGRDGGIAILPTFRLNKSMLSAGEKQDMLSALQALASTGASDRETLGKLNAFFGGQQADWVRIDFADWSGTRSGMLPILKTAILNRQPLAFDYYNSGGDCAPREVCPIRLWFKSSAWYLLAYCMQRRALRTFKLTRILALELLEEIEKTAAARDLVQDILLEVNLAGEASKSGFSPETVLAGARLAASDSLHAAHRREHGFPRL